ncbi:protein lysB [Burkholderia sp. Bp9015]|uniref:protein lysB n=1 Tax=Burkholderia sp. Bp9015 TaxID=2184563 RepID=UPI000F5B3CC4|nr:protein lysB [Burkholderia sp. Bp9015]RQR78691.1 protein lysB [Burkholderia sp. Bp9015]
MSSLVIKLLLGAALLGALAGGALYVRALRAENDDLTDKLGQAKASIAARDATISGLKSDAVEKGRQQTQLDSSTAAVETVTSTIRQQIRKAVNENAAARAWADTPLPDDVARLSARSARTGTANFGAAMPDAVAVHAAGAVAAD